MIDRAWSMFTPFKPGGDPAAGAPPTGAPPTGAPPAVEQENAALRAEIERLRRELAAKVGKTG
jgi:hypothetical protein